MPLPRSRTRRGFDQHIGATVRYRIVTAPRCPPQGAYPAHRAIRNVSRPTLHRQATDLPAHPSVDLPSDSGLNALSLLHRLSAVIERKALRSTTGRPSTTDRLSTQAPTSATAQPCIVLGPLVLRARTGHLSATTESSLRIPEKAVRLPSCYSTESTKVYCSALLKATAHAHLPKTDWFS